MAARRLGGLELDRNIELTKTVPLDARQLVRSKEELLDPASFLHGYNGMIVGERTEGKLYMLMDKDNPTVEASWKVIGPYEGSVTWDDVQNKPTFATVATSGSYNDLSDQPTIPEPYDDSALDARVTALENAPSTAPTWNDVTGKPDFANVATSGSYNDLGDKPTIPEAYDDTEVRNLIAAKANSADLAPVATSGSYNDLGDKPTIPEAYDDTELRGLIAAKANSADLATVATSGSYNDLGDKPTIPEAYDDTVLAARVTAVENGKANTADLATVATSGSYNDLGDKPTIPEAYDYTALATRVTAVENGKANSADLAAVATSGSYNDLSDKPTIPEAYDDTALAARVTAVEADLGGLATVASSGSYNDLSDKPTIPAEVTVDAAMSDTSENPVQNKVVLAAITDAVDVVEANVYTKTETDAKIAEAMTDVDNNHFHVVTALPDPSVAKENHEYVLVTYAQDGTTIESETHYLFYDGVFHQRTTQISLDGYATEAYVGEQLDTLATVATSGSYDDLSDKPTIPEAYDDTALAARVTAVEDGKASLQVAAIPGGGGGEEINALVSQGENSVSVSYYKDGTLPNTLNLNVDSDYFSIPTTAYADEKAAQAQSNAQIYADLKLAQKQNTLVSGQNIKSVNGNSLVGNGDLLIREGVVVIDVTSPPTMTEIEGYIKQTGAIVKNGAEYYTAYTYSRDDEAETFIIVCLGAVEGLIGSKFFWFNQIGNDSIVFDRVTDSPSTRFGTAYRSDTLYYASVRKTANDQMLFAVYNNTPDLVDVNFYCNDPRGGTGNIQLPTKGYVDGKSGVNIKVGEEKWQGTYTDENGETFQVYSKMVYIPALPATAGITTYDHGVSNIKQILNIYGFTTDGFVLNAPRQNAQDNIAIYQASKSATNQTFSIEVGKDRSNKAAYVVMVYAKNN